MSTGISISVARRQSNASDTERVSFMSGVSSKHVDDNKVLMGADDGNNIFVSLVVCHMLNIYNSLFYNINLKGWILCYWWDIIWNGSRLAFILYSYIKFYPNIFIA